MPKSICKRYKSKKQRRLCYATDGFKKPARKRSAKKKSAKKKRR